MGSGEWGVGSGEWGVGSGKLYTTHSRISRYSTYDARNYIETFVLTVFHLQNSYI